MTFVKVFPIHKLARIWKKNSILKKAKLYASYKQNKHIILLETWQLHAHFLWRSEQPDNWQELPLLFHLMNEGKCMYLPIYWLNSVGQSESTTSL